MHSESERQRKRIKNTVQDINSKLNILLATNGQQRNYPDFEGR